MGFGFAIAGSFLGLTCMIRARRLESGDRIRWLAFASLAIGGTGIWMMHFIAMIGFTVSGSEVRYDIGITILSLVISILSVAFGIFVVGLGKSSLAKVFVGGPLTGFGVVSMHYTGMAAMNVSGSIEYNPMWVASSVVIAIVAATAALFFTIWVETKRAHMAASVLMALAVCGMHYTGMGAISVKLYTDGPMSVPGVDPLLLLIPILLLATAVLIGLIFGVLGGGDESSPVRAQSRALAEPMEQTVSAPVRPSAGPVAKSTVEEPVRSSVFDVADEPGPSMERSSADKIASSSFFDDVDDAGSESFERRRPGAVAAAMANRDHPRPSASSREDSDWRDQRLSGVGPGF